MIYRKANPSARMRSANKNGTEGTTDEHLLNVSEPEDHVTSLDILKKTELVIKFFQSLDTTQASLHPDFKDNCNHKPNCEDLGILMSKMHSLLQ